MTKPVRKVILDAIPDRWHRAIETAVGDPWWRVVSPVLHANLEAYLWLQQMTRETAQQELR